MKNKEVMAAFMTAVSWLLLPDVNMSKPQYICSLIILYMVSWSLITWIECRLEEKRNREKKRQRKRVPVRSSDDEYVLWERYADGTMHKVPMPR